MSVQTLINGNRASFVNLTVRAADRDLPKGCITALNYNPTQEPGLVQGNLNVPMGRTQGYASCTGSIEILLSELVDFLSVLTNDGTFAIADVDFDIIAQWAVNDFDVQTDTLLGCRITNLDFNNQQGSDPTKRTLALSIMRVLIAGIPVYGSPDEVATP